MTHSSLLLKTQHLILTYCLLQTQAFAETALFTAKVIPEGYKKIFSLGTKQDTTFNEGEDHFTECLHGKKIAKKSTLGMWSSLEEEASDDEFQADFVYIPEQQSKLHVITFFFTDGEHRKKAIRAVNQSLYPGVSNKLEPLHDQKFALIVNPVSGDREGEASGRVIEESLKRLGSTVHKHTTTPQVESLNSFVLETAKNCNAIIIIGGDGTLKQVVEAASNESCLNIPMAIMSRGTGNGIACSLNIETPAKGLKQMLYCLKHTDLKRCKIDIKKFTATWADNVTETGKMMLSLTAGFVADVDIGSELIRSIGKARLNIWTIYELARWHSHHMKLSYKPEDSNRQTNGTDERYIHVVAMNVPYAAKAVNLAATAMPESDTLELVTIRSNSVGRIKGAQILMQIKTGDYINHHDVQNITVQDLTIESPSGCNRLVIDGELLQHNNDHPIKVELSSTRKTVTFLTPASQQANPVASSPSPSSNYSPSPETIPAAEH